MSNISGGGGGEGRTARAKGNMKVLEVHQVKQGIDQNKVLLTLDPQAQNKSSPEGKNILLQA